MPDTSKLPAIYLPHGGGPWHVMEDAFGDGAGHERLRAWLASLGEAYKRKAKALLIVSAHWEERLPTLHFGAKPGMLYDYGGFPDFTYSLSWPAAGSPDLAARAEELLKKAGIESACETERGYDHGTFVPMMVAFPEASIPVAQLSLIEGLDPERHFELGRALEPLREEGVLILGSGMSYHNMRGFFSGGPAVAESSRRFDDWLAEVVAVEDPEKRRAALVDWRNAPSALDCHPRSEHLVPLFVIAGAAGSDPGRRDYSSSLMGARISSHVFG